MMQWVDESILHGEPIKLFLVPASAEPCLLDGAYKIPLAANK